MRACVRADDVTAGSARSRVGAERPVARPGERYRPTAVLDHASDAGRRNTVHGRQKYAPAAAATAALRRLLLLTTTTTAITVANECRCIKPAVFKLGSADQRGSATGSHGVRERIPKSSNCLHGFQQFTTHMFQLCTHKSVTQSQCIAWKCCRGLARQAFC